MHNSPSTLDLARSPGTAVIWLARPDKGNALDGAAIGELQHTLDGLLTDANVRVIVLAGRGEAFCKGLDLDWLSQASPAELQSAATVLATLSQADKPIIVRAHGACAGFGMALAAAATVTVAARDAQFSHPGALLGITPSLSAPVIAAAIGTRATRRWLLTGEIMDASEAWRLGLAHELCEADELDARINQILGHLINTAPAATRATLVLLHANNTLKPAAQVRDLAACLASADTRAGIAACRQQQAPPWVAKILREMSDEMAG